MRRTYLSTLLCLWLASLGSLAIAQVTTNLDASVVGRGGLLLNARTVRFHLGVFKAGGHLSGHFDLFELSATASRSVHVQMTRVNSLVIEGTTAYIGGVGLMNRRPVHIRIEARDFGPMLTVLDQLKVTAFTSNTTAPYVVEGSVWPGDIKIWRAPNIVHRIRGLGAIHSSNTSVGKFWIDISEVAPPSNDVRRFLGGFTYIDQDMVATRIPIEVKSVEVMSLTVDGNGAQVYGTATMNGSGVFFTLRLFDGRMSPLPDTFAIELTRGPAVVYRASGNVFNGDIDIW